MISDLSHISASVLISNWSKLFQGQVAHSELLFWKSPGDSWTRTGQWKLWWWKAGPSLPWESYILNSNPAAAATLCEGFPTDSQQRFIAFCLWNCSLLGSCTIHLSCCSHLQPCAVQYHLYFPLAQYFFSVFQMLNRLDLTLMPLVTNSTSSSCSIGYCSWYHSLCSQSVSLISTHIAVSLNKTAVLVQRSLELQEQNTSWLSYMLHRKWTSIFLIQRRSLPTLIIIKVNDITVMLGNIF